MESDNQDSIEAIEFELATKCSGCRTRPSYFGVCPWCGGTGLQRDVLPDDLSGTLLKILRQTGVK